MAWHDSVFGELQFDKQASNRQIIVMRNEHNYGKPVFGLLCVDLIREALCQQYKAGDVARVIKEMVKTFSEAKQAGFFGRGIKSCSNLPLLAGTDYKVLLKPAKNFALTFRVYGRTIQNGEHTLFIFNTLNVNPKSVASKLLVLEPDQPSATLENEVSSPHFLI